MAQFVAFEKGIEVNGETVLSIVNAMEGFEEFARTILEINGIEDPTPGKWYSQQAWLEAFRQIAEKVGEKTLFNIGKAIPENARFPAEINNVLDALASIDVAYHMNHRNSEGEVLYDPVTGEIKQGIGHYSLVEFNQKERNAVMECPNPYPSHFDRGIITTMVRKFAPEAAGVHVILDENRPTRLEGEDSCTYIITW
ncbi:MAG: hypothetical protein KJ607_10615 [Bacteroidetes bacterium]|nr:hypothetical protein [Bacteroidota bacterium]